MRKPQLMTDFRPGDPHGGYYTDLTGAARQLGEGPRDALAGLSRLTGDRAAANPVSIAQAGLGAWQLGMHDPAWRGVLANVVDWLLGAADESGLLAYLFPMPHTYRLSAPWYSAMAQAEAASLLVRGARTLEDDTLHSAAVRFVRPLMEPSVGLVTETAEGPVLQEYPTHPASHVLNGWISALWGLYDVSHADYAAELERDRVGEAFVAGVTALVARLPLYRIGRGWSRYDLYPHPIPNVASPFYHRLHVEQLAALDRLAPHDALRRTSEEWRRALGHPLTVGTAVARKVAFRAVRPRARWIRVPWNRRVAA